MREELSTLSSLLFSQGLYSRAGRVNSILDSIKTAERKDRKEEYTKDSLCSYIISIPVDKAASFYWLEHASGIIGAIQSSALAYCKNPNGKVALDARRLVNKGIKGGTCDDDFAKEHCQNYIDQVLNSHCPAISSSMSPLGAYIDQMISMYPKVKIDLSRSIDGVDNDRVKYAISQANKATLCGGFKGIAAAFGPDSSFIDSLDANIKDVWLATGASESDLWRVVTVALKDAVSKSDGSPFLIQAVIDKLGSEEAVLKKASSINIDEFVTVKKSD